MRRNKGYLELRPEYMMDGELAPNDREIEAAPPTDPARYDDEISALRAIVEGTARATGEAFFQSLVRHLASAIGVRYAFVAEFAGVETRVRTIAYWGPDGLRPNVEFDLDGTPCEDVIRGGLCHHPSGRRRKR
jgi:formate hydrogenlyase transcriptional activator